MDDSLDLSDIAEPAAPRRRPRDLSDPLETIAHYESGDRNVPNYRFDRGHTAQGNYQITNTNWRNYGPKAGVDTSQYPSAMAAPKEVQRNVANTMFQERGFSDWAPYNPALRTALKRGEGQGKPTPTPDLSDIAEPASKPPSLDLSDIAEGNKAAPSKPTSAFPAVSGGVRGAVSQPNAPTQASQAANDQLAHDIEWHFGTGMLYAFSKLDVAKQREIAKLATDFRRADEAKRQRGEDITKSPAWQLANQRRVGLEEGRDYEARTSPEVGATQQQQWRESTAALSAAGNPLLNMPRGLRAVTEPVSKGLAGIAHFGAGAARAAGNIGDTAGPIGQGAAAIGRAVQPKLEQAASFYGQPPAEAEAVGQSPAVQQQMGQMGYGEQVAKSAPFNRPTRFAQGLGQGIVEFAPLMALGHPEGALASIGTGAGTFGGYTGLQKYGEGASAEEALKEGAKSAPFGALIGVPTRTLGTVVDSELRNAVTSVGLKGAGYYGLGRAEGMSHDEALQNAAALTAFAAPELGGAVLNTLIGHAARGPAAVPSVDTATGRPMEPAVKSAIESAFEVAQVSPEAAEKALKTPVVEPSKPANTEDVERYQWMRNKEGQQKFGTQTEVHPLNEDVYNRYVKIADQATTPLNAFQDYGIAAAKTLSFEEWKTLHPEATHVALYKAEGQGDWILQNVGPAKNLRPNQQTAQWAKQVDAFDSSEAQQFGGIADSEQPQSAPLNSPLGTALTEEQPEGEVAGPIGLTDKYKNQRGALGEPPEKPKPAPPGVKTGAVEDRPAETKKAEPIIGIVGSDGVVQGKPDPERTLEHGRTFPDQWTSTDHWHYEPSTETVYWTSGDMLISDASKHAAENWLERRGMAVKGHGSYTSYLNAINQLGDTEANRALHLTSDEQATLAELGKTYGAPAAEHPSATQPRTPETGQFAAANDLNAVSKELLNAGNKMQDDYARLAAHPARHDLSTAPEMSVRNYFRQLYTFVNTHAPEKLPLVRQAEDAQYAGDSVKATVFSERALGNTHDFANKLSNAVLATRMLSKGVKLNVTTDWSGVLRQVREGKARAERWKGQEGAIGERPEPPKPGPEGVRTGAVADLEAARREKERSLPKHLAATEREPGADLTYTELPNKLTKARVEKRIADEGIAATEDWYNAQEAKHPEQGAELTDAFRQLSDHYLTKLANATGKTEIADLTAKAKQLAGTEAPRSTGLGQAVQAYAMLDKYTGPEVLLEATRLAERAGKQLPDEIVADIAKTGQEFKTADEQLAEVRKELAKVEKGLGPGKGPGKGGTGASRARIEQLRDQQTKIIEARQQARIRQEQTLAKLERTPTPLDYLTKFNNIIRGFMVSSIPTAVRNYETQGLRFGVERLVDLFAHGMRLATAQDPHISFSNIHRDTLRLFQSESRSKAVSIAGEYPKELRRLFATYGGGQVESAQATRSFAGRVERAFGGVERFVQTVNWLNQLQEFHIRGAEFLSHMDMLVERKHSQTLEQFMREKGADKLSKEMITDSVDHALEVTFADLPAADTRIGQHMRSIINLGNLVPPTVSPIPFARWFYNSWKFNYQFSPLGLADLVRTPRQLREARRALQRIEVRPPAKTEANVARRQVELEKARANVTRLTESAKIERYRTVAKAAIGTAFLGTAYAARSSSLAGEKWYEMRVPGTEQMIDARPFAPFSTYLFLAEGLRRSIHGERPFSKTEFYAAIGASTAATGGMEVLYDKYRRGDFDSLMRALKSEGGDLGSAILTPVRQIRDIIGEFDKSQSTTYDTATQPGLGPIKASIPYGERLGTPLPAAHKPLSDEPIHATHPITKFLGPRIITPKNFVEREADRLRFDYNEVRPATGVPQIDQLEEQWMGEFIGRRAAKLANNPNYARQPDGVKAELYLKPLFAAGSSYARQRLAGEHPDLYRKLIERSKSARQRAMEKDFGAKPLANPY